jgi:prepilin-type N-terminal cleavage/methylation domain-containing protein
MFCRTARTSAASAARHTRGEDGFTLIEVMIVSALFLLVMGIVFSMLVSAQRSEAFENGRGQALDDMTVTMDRLTKDLRQATSVIGTPTASHIEMMTYDNGALQDVVYDASGTTLTRTEAGLRSIQQKGLANTAVFDYVPSTTTPQDVQIALIVAPPNLPSTTVTLDGEVHLRNLGS